MKIRESRRTVVPRTCPNCFAHPSHLRSSRVETPTHRSLPWSLAVLVQVAIQASPQSLTSSRSLEFYINRSHQNKLNKCWKKMLASFSQMFCFTQSGSFSKWPEAGTSTLRSNEVLAGWIDELLRSDKRRSIWLSRAIWVVLLRIELKLTPRTHTNHTNHSNHKDGQFSDLQPSSPWCISLLHIEHLWAICA